MTSTGRFPRKESFMTVNPFSLDGDPLMTPGEVADLWRVHAKTTTRWAKAGKIGSIRTPGGHRRFRKSEVMALLAAEDAGQNEAGGAL